LKSYFRHETSFSVFLIQRGQRPIVRGHTPRWGSVHEWSQGTGFIKTYFNFVFNSSFSSHAKRKFCYLH